MNVSKNTAYLLIVHKNTYVLEKLLELLDDVNSDIYIHVDKKCKDFDWNKYKSIVHKSQIIYLKDRYEGYWGGYSLVKIELALIRAARSNQEYKWYHLLSGQDLPIKSQREIKDFFDSHAGQLFVESEDVSKSQTKVYNRVAVKQAFLKKRAYTKSKISRKFLGGLNRCYSIFQRKILKRDLVRKKHIELKYGSQWFSLPNNAIEFILKNEFKIDKYFKYAACSDELFIQTILSEGNFHFENNNQRLINWNLGSGDGHPYVWREKDYNTLIKSERLFARRFDESIDKKIIDQVFNHIK